MEDLQHETRNFVLNAAEGALFISSGAFLSAQTVLPALITRLGGSNVEVGALGVFSYAGLFLPQIFAARYVETLPRKLPWALTYGALHRLVVLLMGASILVFGVSRPLLALWLLLGFVLVMQILVGISTPGWFDMFTKLTRVTRRGRLIGIRTSLGGASAFVGSLVLTWLLGNVSFPLSFACAFFIGFALQTASLAVQWNLVETVPSRTVPRRPLSEFIRAIPQVLRTNHAFRLFLGSSALLVVATMPVGFFAVYALRHFGAPDIIIGEFTLIIVATQVVSALVNGYIADRFGNKVVLILAAGAMLCATLIAFVAPSTGWYRLVFLFVGVVLGSETMARYNIAVEFGPPERRSTYVGMMNTLLSPMYLSGLAGGWLIDRLGFHTLFAVAAGFSLLGIWVLVFRVRDPRRAAHAPANT